MTWGIEHEVTERFVAAGVPSENISFRRDTYRFEYSAPPSDVVAEFSSYYGPTMNAFDAAAENGRTEDLERKLVALFDGSV